MMIMNSLTVFFMRIMGISECRDLSIVTPFLNMPQQEVADSRRKASFQGRSWIPQLVYLDVIEKSIPFAFF